MVTVVESEEQFDAAIAGVSTIFIFYADFVKQNVEHLGRRRLFRHLVRSM